MSRARVPPLDTVNFTVRLGRPTWPSVTTALTPYGDCGDASPASSAMDAASTPSVTR